MRLWRLSWRPLLALAYVAATLLLGAEPALVQLLRLGREQPLPDIDAVLPQPRGTAARRVRGVRHGVHHPADPGGRTDAALEELLGQQP